MSVDEMIRHAKRVYLEASRLHHTKIANRAAMLMHHLYSRKSAH